MIYDAYNPYIHTYLIIYIITSLCKTCVSSNQLRKQETPWEVLCRRNPVLPRDAIFWVNIWRKREALEIFALTWMELTMPADNIRLLQQPWTCCQIWETILLMLIFQLLILPLPLKIPLTCQKISGMHF